MENFYCEWEKNKERQILEKFENSISDLSDFFADKDPNLLSYFLIYKLGYLLDSNPDNVLSEDGVRIRRAINPIVKAVAVKFLKSRQIIENRKKLLDPNSKELDKGITLPSAPVIWAPNHSFTDDILATVLAADRHAYILLASLPQVYNTLDGITSWLNGAILINRKVRESKRSTIPKAKKVFEYGSDIIMFPEGVWNKTPNKLLLHFWPGIYRLAKETGAAVVPVAHYIEDPTLQKKNNAIHTVVDDPVKIDYMPEKEALEMLREIIGTWYYLMMEKYGQTTRNEALTGYVDSVEAWEQQLNDRVSTVSRYDRQIEFFADYRPKDIIEPEAVFDSIANIENVTADNILHVVDAKKIVKNRYRNNFQNRF